MRLRRIEPSQVASQNRPAVPSEVLSASAQIVEDVRDRGEAALREHAERLGDLEPGAPLTLSPTEVAERATILPPSDREVIDRVAARVREFASAQRRSLADLDVAVLGGRAGHRVAPVESAGCYAPGGRYPLPSSALMTAVTARAAGVETVWLASPRPTAATLAAAHAAAVDGVLCVGGAQAIAALAYGAGPVPACAAVVGPGNVWVTAAKRLVNGDVAIDMLAGPSELVVIADETANPGTVAADLLAQAEHDTEARPILLTTHAPLQDEVERELDFQLASLPTRATAEAALANGFSVLCVDLDQAAALSDLIAPEHLQLSTRDPRRLRVRQYGGLFVGETSAEVMGDYGAGPNHTLPTGGTARTTAGLSVLTFLRAQTWLELSDPSALIADTAALARMEGLEAHARAAERRR